jgi:hypothetical protein
MHSQNTSADPRDDMTPLGAIQFENARLREALREQ